MAAKQKYYVVWNGRKRGIFSSWAECEVQVKGFEDAQYKSFPTKSTAEAAYNKTYHDAVSKKAVPQLLDLNAGEIRPDFNSIAVDAACSGNPGDMEYRGVWTKNGQEIFRMGPYRQGTNNIGEFLAIVHGLAYLKQKNSNLAIYSDSRTAQLWIKKKKCASKLERTNENIRIFDLIDRAEKWLQNNTYSNLILKWHTEIWGEIPADFGRK